MTCLDVILCFIVRNIYVFFAPVPGKELPKSLELLSDHTDKGIFIFMKSPFQSHLSLC